MSLEAVLYCIFHKEVERERLTFITKISDTLVLWGMHFAMNTRNCVNTFVFAFRQLQPFLVRSCQMKEEKKTQREMSSLNRER
jgi:hypothetical protein